MPAVVLGGGSYYERTDWKSKKQSDEDMFSSCARIHSAHSPNYPLRHFTAPMIDRKPSRTAAAAMVFEEGLVWRPEAAGLMETLFVAERTYEVTRILYHPSIPAMPESLTRADVFRYCTRLAGRRGCKFRVPRGSCCPYSRNRPGQDLACCCRPRSRGRSCIQRRPPGEGGCEEGEMPRVLVRFN